MIDYLIGLLAPHECVSCGKVGRLLCAACSDELTSEARVCIGCGIENDDLCDTCRADWPVDHAFTFGPRSGPVKELIDELKYGNKRASANDLATLAAAALPYVERGTIVPLPTLGSHVRRRGYDHAALVAKRISRLTGLSYTPVLRRANRSIQHGASRARRALNAVGMFKVRRMFDPDEIYIVFDDIVTTGASLKSAVAELRRNGARHVWTLVLARQPLDADK